ncbi:MAG: hypothetical protein HYU80_02980 [Candidatus Blackburnbacteria bacterium]|nr:hypothetical protein [Candidatus Blackburnbacteria bacterium]
MPAKRKTTKTTKTPAKTTYRKTTSSSTQNIMVLGVALLIAIAGFVYLKDRKSSDLVSIARQPEELTVSLEQQNKSGEYGTATITEKDGKVVVVLSLSGSPKNPQPAHIHLGTCPTIGAVKYPLSNVVDGKSETLLDINLDTLKSSLPLVLSVHKSVPQAKVYVACGDILK